MTVDDELPYEGDRFSDDVQCSLFVDYYLENGTHNMAIELIESGEKATKGEAITPMLHLTDIV